MKQTKRILRIGVARLNDDSPDVSYLEQEGFEDRLAQLNRSEFGFIGIRACADVTIGGVCQSIYWGGLWGIESDSEESYLKDAKANQ